MARVALLGDSIFDNKAYVGTEADVVGHLRQLAPDWKFDLHAVDGNLARHVLDQLRNIDDEVAYLVVSAGGNNAIDNADLLQMNVGSSSEVLSSLADRARRFEEEYHQMLTGLAATGRPFIVSTVYYPNISEEAVQDVAKAALATFNDVIISLGARFQAPILDLRLVCTGPGDYANEIEPSGAGGKKIAAAIIRAVERRISGETGCVVYY